MKKARNFTLLEVLIGLALVTIALPLLITPFLYESVNLSESKKAVEQNALERNVLRDLLEALQTEKIALSQTPGNDWIEFEGATYRLTPIHPKKIEEEKGASLWELTLRIDEKETAYKIAKGKDS